MANISVIVDIGSATVKAGFSTDQEPNLFIEPLVGIERLPNVTGYIKKSTVGPNARKNLTLQQIIPIQRGEIIDVDSLLEIFEYIYDKLSYGQIQPDKFLVVLCQNALNMTSETKKFIVAMYEKFSINELYCGDNAKFTASALGKDCALALQCGHGITECSPVYSGYCIPNASRKINFGGYDINQELKKFFNENKQPVITENDAEHVQKIKETCCQVLYGENRLKPSDEEITTEFKSSHGCCYSIGKTRFTIVEQLFNSKNGCQRSVQELVLEVFNNCDEQIKEDAIKNVIISGGASLLYGFPERLAEEISPHRSDVKIICVPNRKHLAYAGASKFSLYNPFWLTKSDIEEYGERAMYQKFI